MGDGPALQFQVGLPNGCPPADAKLGPLEVFRAVEVFPSQDEFWTARESNKFVGSNECLRSGISVLPDLPAVRHHQVLFPWRTVTIHAVLTHEHGMTMPTPSRKQPAHLTWWPPDGLNRVSIFSVHKA